MNKKGKVYIMEAVIYLPFDGLSKKRGEPHGSDFLFEWHR